MEPAARSSGGWRRGGTVGYLTATTTEVYRGDRSAVAIAPAAEIDSGCLLMSLLTNANSV